MDSYKKYRARLINGEILEFTLTSDDIENLVRLELIEKGTWMSINGKRINTRYFMEIEEIG